MQCTQEMESKLIQSFPTQHADSLFSTNLSQPKALSTKITKPPHQILFCMLVPGPFSPRKPTEFTYIHSINPCCYWKYGSYKAGAIRQRPLKVSGNIRDLGVVPGKGPCLLPLSTTSGNPHLPHKHLLLEICCFLNIQTSGLTFKRANNPQIQFKSMEDAGAQYF